MSLYNIMYGECKVAPMLWEWLGLDDYMVGRYRDMYLSDDYSEIVLLTRNGGGNREEYQECFDSLETHPHYLRDKDCDWDCTYAEIFFSIPPQHQETVHQWIKEREKKGGNETDEKEESE